MRVALVIEGTYPYVTGGVSTWCGQLVGGLFVVIWDLVAIVGVEPDRPVMRLPDNVRTLTAVPVWGPVRPARDRAERAAARLCRGMLGESPAGLAVFAEGLRQLAELAQPGRRSSLRQSVPPLPRRRPGGPFGPLRRLGIGRRPLAATPLADVLVDAWATAQRDGVRLPRLTLRDADEAALLIAHAVRPLGELVPSEVDVVHANANGLTSMEALAAKWRTGVPFLMTEHGVYLLERYLNSNEQSPAVKSALLRFHRSLARLAYAEDD